MKTFIAKIRIDGLGGSVLERDHTFKARTERSARAMAYRVIGNQTGEIVSIRGAGDREPPPFEPHYEDSIDRNTEIYLNLK